MRTGAPSWTPGPEWTWDAPRRVSRLGHRLPHCFGEASQIFAGDIRRPIERALEVIPVVFTENGPLGSLPGASEGWDETAPLRSRKIRWACPWRPPPSVEPRWTCPSARKRSCLRGSAIPAQAARLPIPPEFPWEGRRPEPLRSGQDAARFFLPLH